jgi:sialate O-acetylesterase
LIVTIDIGEASDIHPKNKLVVGNRMARWALGDVYGRKLVAGPVLRKTELKGDRVVFYFSEVGVGLRTRDGGPLSEFAITGEGKKWIWAKAEIVGKDKIEVRAEAAKRPVAVRYAFNTRKPNLTNDSGFPASPFRTDNWPDPTTGKR